MENVIVYAIIAIAVVVNIVRTYKEEAKKNKGRAISQPQRPVAPPSPAPFSRPQVVQPVQETPRTSGSQNVSQSQPIQRNFSEEGVSAIQQYIDSQEKIEKDNNKRLSIIEDSEVEYFDLKLETAEDFKRAFVHSLIFERKY